MANKPKKIKPNRYKPEAHSGTPARPKAPQGRWLARSVWVFLLAGIMSLSAIWCHDAVVQSPFFTIRTVDITGLHRVSREALLACADLDRKRNLFDIRPDEIEMKLSGQPWIASAHVKRRLFSGLSIQVEEQRPLAIVAIENLADLVINTQGAPFKEYEPEKDRLDTLPVITGMDLTLSENIYRFEGELFNSVMELLKVKGLGDIRSIHGDPHTGILIQAPDIYNRYPVPETDETDIGETAETENTEGADPEQTAGTVPRILIPIKLGFDHFDEKLAKAVDISRYMAARFPDKTILAMDLFDMERIFIKTEDTLRHSS